MNVITVIMASMAGVCVTWAAAADTFSASSDRNPDGPTVAGGLGPVPSLSIGDARVLDLNNRISFGLDYDLNDNLPGGAGAVATQFQFSGVMSEYARLNVGGLFYHTYVVSGAMRFIEESGSATALFVEFSRARFYSISANPDAWGQTATLQADDSIAGTNLSMTAGGALAGRDLTRDRDFSLGLSDLRQVSGGAVQVNAAGFPITGWQAEASFAAHAIPSAGSLALLAGAGILSSRRRRS